MSLDICLNCFKSKGEFEVCPHCGFVEGTPPDQAYHLFPGTTLAGRYVIGTVIDFGGFGVIYRAWDTHLSKLMAIKEFFPSGLVTREAGGTVVTAFSRAKENGEYERALSRFLLEARTLATFRESPYIVNVFNFFEENNTAYFVMEFLDGISLSDYIAQMPVDKMDADEAFELIKPVIEGLIAIHAAGIIHRDIHPGNIFITTNNQVKIIDFGAARLSTGDEEKTLTVVATQGYTAPEQYRNKSKQGPYTDIYGLAATLYRMLTGIIPEEAPDRQVNDTLARPLDIKVLISKNADNAIMRALAVNPELRYQKAADFRDALLLGKKADDPSAVLRKRVTRRAFVFGGIGVLAVGGGVAAYLLNTVFKPAPTLANVIVSDTELAFWIPVTGKEATWDAQLALWQSLADDFTSSVAEKNENGNPNVTIQLVPKSTTSYAQELEDAATKNELPTLFFCDFSDTSTDTGLLSQAASLEMLIESISMDNYMFFGRYDSLFADQKRIPLGFDLMTLIGDENMAATIETAANELPKSVPSFDMLYLPDKPVSITSAAYSLFLALYRPELADTSGITITDADSLAKDLQTISTYDKQTSKSKPVQLLADDKLLYLVDMVSDYPAISAAAAGQYQVLKISNNENQAGRFRDLCSVSASADSNQQHAAMLFIAHLISDYAQNLLNVQNQNALPINRGTFGDYISSKPGLAYLGDLEKSEDNVLFYDLDRPELVDFGSQFVSQIILKNAKSDDIVNFVENWKNKHDSSTADQGSTEGGQ